MVKIARITFILQLIVLLAMTCRAQSYLTAAGIRAGTELGLTIQQRIYSTGTLEGIVTTNRYRWQTQVLVEHHRKFIGKRLNYYFGIGPHIGNEKGYGNYWGLTPISGIEATLAGINISWDYKPSLNFGGGSSLFFHDSGISIRLIVFKQPKKQPVKEFFQKLGGDGKE